MSTQLTIQQMNEAIARFEGRKFFGKTIDHFGGDTGNALPEMKYHKSWSWLMPALRKYGELPCDPKLSKHWDDIVDKGLSMLDITITHKLLYEAIVTEADVIRKTKKRRQ